ncbi:hypothetical protein J3458_013200 [Metarhizium acridum]|uniref:uncharacterized protein n=1 Tax=Metarhizium acridum TaxID=92637 RepID=UPI001C6C69DE|nr:hypothetical protein J3458_013200 [Metarhizium acridum]
MYNGVFEDAGNETQYYSRYWVNLIPHHSLQTTHLWTMLHSLLVWVGFVPGTVGLLVPIGRQGTRPGYLLLRWSQVSRALAAASWAKLSVSPLVIVFSYVGQGAARPG